MGCSYQFLQEGGRTIVKIFLNQKGGVPGIVDSSISLTTDNKVFYSVSDDYIDLIDNLKRSYGVEKIIKKEFANKD